MRSGPSTRPRIEGFRPEQQTLVDDLERASIPAPSTLPKNRGLLTVLSGRQRGSVHRIPSEGGTIGRSDAATVSIGDPGLSRIHARIHREADAFHIEDAGSTNGTFIGRERLHTRTQLTDGVQIRLGSTVRVKFSLHDEIDEAATLSVHRAALHDHLTGVYNRRVFDDRLKGELAFAHRHRSHLSVLLLDVDHFKQLNDEHGHLAGDAVLAAIAKVIQQSLRQEDVVARYGGEEFSVIARGAARRDARLLAERIRGAVEATRIPFGGAELRVHVSIGVATFGNGRTFPDVSALVAAADTALYEAKRQGRNQVISFDDSRRG